jgi:curved DNA-binding protein CbpA
MTPFVNYYEVLGVNENASDEIIKLAYRRLIKKYHPDFNPNNKSALERTQQLNLAYEILSNSGKKYNFNQQLREHTSHNRQANPSYRPNTSRDWYVDDSAEILRNWANGYNSRLNDEEIKKEALKLLIKQILKGNKTYKIFDILNQSSNSMSIDELVLFQTAIREIFSELRNQWNLDQAHDMLAIAELIAKIVVDKMDKEMAYDNSYFKVKTKR